MFFFFCILFFFCEMVLLAKDSLFQFFPEHYFNKLHSTETLSEPVRVEKTTNNKINAMTLFKKKNTKMVKLRWKKAHSLSNHEKREKKLCKNAKNAQLNCDI